MIFYQTKIQQDNKNKSYLAENVLVMWSAVTDRQVLHFVFAIISNVCF